MSEHTTDACKTPHPKSDCSPTQVVVVQQGSSKDDGASVGKFIDALLGDKKKEAGEPDKPPVTSIAIKLTQQNFLIVVVILLAILVAFLHHLDATAKAAQVEAVNKTHNILVLKMGQATSNLTGAVAPPVTGSATDDAQKTMNAILHAVKDVDRHLLLIRSSEKPDPISMLALAIAKQPPTPVYFSYPSAYPTIAQPGLASATLVASEMRKIPIRPDLEVCFTVPEQKANPPAASTLETTKEKCKVRISPWKEKLLSPPTVEVLLTNHSKNNLDLLDFEAILETIRRSDTDGLEGICPPPRRGSQPWKVDEQITKRVDLKLAPYWTSSARKEAVRAWEKGDVYLTLCTTIRIPGSIPILDRSVYRVKVTDNTGELTAPAEDGEAVILQ
jgi:hypothetical protein